MRIDREIIHREGNAHRRSFWHNRVLGDGAREFSKAPQALVADDQAVIRILTAPSVITGAGALMPVAFFPIHSRATVTL